MRVVVTGASGVLGTAVYSKFQNAGHTVLGLAHSRASGELKSIDLLDSRRVEDIFGDFRPDWVVHCAAERRPDVAQQDPERAEKLNAQVPGHLARLAKALKFMLIYISTDYVFDGNSPPYTPSAATNPSNTYGQSKRDGELAVLGVVGAKAVVLRVPVLYGPAPLNTDSAINCLLDIVADQSGKTYKMDHYQTRYPTNVLDISDFLVRLAAIPPPLPPILHFAASEPFTKYEICLVFAKLLGVSHAHITPDSDPPKTGTIRPKDTQLYLRETEDLMGGTGLDCSLFEEWWTAHIKGSGSE